MSHASALAQVVEGGDVGAFILAHLVTRVELADDDHVALVKVGIDIPVRVVARHDALQLRGPCDAQFVAHVEIDGVRAHGRRWQDGENEVFYIFRHGADFRLCRDPCGQVLYLIVLRTGVEFVELELDDLGFRTVLDESGRRAAPFDDGEFGIELPHDGVGDVAMAVLDVADGHGELVAVHFWKHFITEGDVDLTV